MSFTLKLRGQILIGSQDDITILSSKSPGIIYESVISYRNNVLEEKVCNKNGLMIFGMFSFQHDQTKPFLTLKGI